MVTDCAKSPGSREHVEKETLLGQSIAWSTELSAKTGPDLRGHLEEDEETIMWLYILVYGVLPSAPKTTWSLSIHS